MSQKYKRKGHHVGNLGAKSLILCELTFQSIGARL